MQSPRGKGGKRKWVGGRKEKNGGGWKKIAGQWQEIGGLETGMAGILRQVLFDMLSLPSILRAMGSN